MNLTPLRACVLLLVIGIHPLLAQKKVKYYEDIEPIVLTRCAPCHHPGTAAPFSLLTYDDVVKKASMIERVVEKRYMPPWKADPSYRSFANEKILTSEEITTIKEWIAQGVPKGKPSKASHKTDHENTSVVKAPDLVLSVQKPYTIAGDRKENFILFVIPFEFDQEYNVESIEYRSSNIKVVHHANFGIYAADPGVDIKGDVDPINSNDLLLHANRQAELTKNLIYYNGWVPGATPISFSKGIGFKLPKRGVIVLTNHYAPTSVQTQESSSLVFHFSKEPITRMVKTLSIGSGGVGEINPPLILLPNEINKFKIQMEIVKPLSLLYVWPHMHLLGKSYKAYYTTPANDSIPLVRINKWDFNWQEAYRFKELTKLPSGSILTIEGVYDNTRDNPANPNDPPQVVLSDGLMGTKSEMLSLILVYIDYQAGDENLTLTP